MVVIAIIGILAALLLPTLARAKQSAHLVACRGNLRQISLATALYVADHGAYQVYYWLKSPGDYDGTIWLCQLDPYLSLPSYSEDKYASGVYRCPGGPPRLKVAVGVTTVRSMAWYLGGAAYYGINAQGTDPITPRGLDGEWPEPPAPLPELVPGVKEASVSVPSDLIAYGDIALYDFGPGWDVIPLGNGYIEAELNY